MKSFGKMVVNGLMCVALSAMTIGLVVNADDEEVIAEVFAKCKTQKTNNVNSGCENAGAKCGTDKLCGVKTTDNTCVCDPKKS